MTADFAVAGINSVTVLRILLCRRWGPAACGGAVLLFAFWQARRSRDAFRISPAYFRLRSGNGGKIWESGRLAMRVATVTNARQNDLLAALPGAELARSRRSAAHHVFSEKALFVRRAVKAVAIPAGVEVVSKSVRSAISRRLWAAATV